MQRYQSIDPFTPSISLRIQNSRRQSTINRVEDIPLPDFLLHRSSTKAEDGKTLDGGMVRSSLESRRSRVGVTMETQTETRGYGQTSGPLGSVIELETRTRPRRGSSHHNQSAQHKESTFMQETRIPYEYPSTSLDNYVRAHHPPEPTVDTHQRSNSFDSYMTRRRRSRPSYSDSIPHAPYDEEKADPRTSASSPSQSLRSLPTGENTSQEEYATLHEVTWTFLTDVVPHQAYLHCLLRLPYLYFSRAKQILYTGNLSLEQIKHMALLVGDGGDDDDGKVTPEIPKRYSRLKESWEMFIDSLLREWKTMNIISGLLLSGILTIFQIEGAQKDPVTRYMAFWSLISALLSLLYGCMFIIHFSGMRRVYQATEWAIEAQRSQALFWNVWIMLAMPAVWLVWSILTYIACIMSFMWRVNVEISLGHHAETVFKVFICCVLGIGVLYAILIVFTLRQFGSKKDDDWRARIEHFNEEQAQKTPQTPIVSPVIRMQAIEPTRSQTLHRLPSSDPWQAPRTSPPATANPLSFADRKKDDDWQARIEHFNGVQAVKKPQTPIVLPVIRMQAIKPTSSQTLHRLPSSDPWQAPRTSPPATPNQSSFVDRKEDDDWQARIEHFSGVQARKTAQTPIVSPVIGIEVIEPTPPQTLRRLPSSDSLQAPRTSPPATPNQLPFADRANHSGPYIPPRPSTPILGVRGSSNPPSPSGIFTYFNMERHTFSASPTPMTPEALTPGQIPRNHPLNAAPGTSETGTGILGLIFDADGEDPSGRYHHLD